MSQFFKDLSLHHVQGKPDVEIVRLPSYITRLLHEFSKKWMWGEGTG
jgi:hypothetical protein